MSNYLIPLFVLIFITSLYSFFWRNNGEKDVDHLSKSIYDYSAHSIDGEPISISKYRGKKILIVNVASRCGYTPQYEELQLLSEQYEDEIEILGFPANDFLWQEPAKNKDIQTFCNVNYGVTFPLVEKTVVKKNKNQHPLFSWLTHKELNGWNDSSPGWNFYKYLIDEKGKLLDIFSSKVNPLDDKIISYFKK